MADKPTGSGGSIGSGSSGYTGSKNTPGEKLGEKNVLIPSVLPDNYLDRVAAAGKGKEGSKSTGSSGGVSQRMTGDNYTEIYKKQQAAQGKDAFLSEEDRKKAATAERQRLDAARASHISSQIDAWQRTMGRDPEQDKRTQATIAALSRELASLKGK